MKNKQVNFNVYNEQYQKAEFIDFCNSYDASFDEIKSVFIDCMKESNGEFNFSNEDFSNIQTPDQLYDFCQVNFAFGGFGKLFGRAKKKITTTFKRLTNKDYRNKYNNVMGKRNERLKARKASKPAAAQNKNLNSGAGSNNAAGAGTTPPASNGNIANPAPRVEPRTEPNPRIDAAREARESRAATPTPPPVNPAGATRPAAQFDKSAQGVSEDLLKRKEAWKQGKSLNTYLHKQEAAAGAATRKVAKTDQGRRLQDAFKTMTEQDKWKLRHGMQTDNVGRKTVNRYINQKNHVKPNTNGANGTPTPGGNKGVKGGDPAKPYWDLMEKARKAGTREEANDLLKLANKARSDILAKQNNLAGRHAGTIFNSGLNPARDATEIATFGFGDWWKHNKIANTAKLGVAGGALYAGGKSAFGGNDE